MSPPWQFAVLATALFGHLALWIAVFSRLHAVDGPRWLIQLLEKLLLAVLFGVCFALVAWGWQTPELLIRPVGVLWALPPVRGYLLLCLGAAVPFLTAWFWRRIRGAPRELLQSRSRVLHVDRHLGRRPCGDRLTHWLARLPGNQILQVEINDKILRVPRLPETLDGLSVVHLSDLHFSGQLSREFFEVVVEQTNRLQPDLVAITGDIVEVPECLPWLGEVLSRLDSRHGVFCILGNHERRLGERSAILSHFPDGGLQYVGGRCVRIPIGGHEVLVAGNELPWWRPAADVAASLVERGEPPALRLLLSHSPDQIHWARRFGFDLMLAGHTHGGQIRLPLIGPIIGQSRYGVAYAGGTFFVPPTLLHVSRGLSGREHVRLLCRPELTRLILRSGATGPRRPA